MIWRAVRACLLWAGLVFGTPALAQSGAVADLNRTAFEAFSAGEIALATARAEEAVALGEAAALAEPVAYLEALNNLVYLRSQNEVLPFDLEGLSDRSVAFAKRTNQIGTATWLNTMNFRAWLLIRLGQPEAAEATMQELTRVMRDTDLQAFAAAVAADVYFATANYRDMAQMTAEMVAVSGASYLRTTLDQLYERQLDREAAADIPAVSALIDTRILLAGVYLPDQRDEFAHAALWTKFYLNQQAENFGAAADALRVWAATGELSEGERDFLREMSDGALMLTQMSGYGERGAVQLGYAELTLAIVELAFDGADPRRGLALRERAAAETEMGLLKQAAATLQDALSVLQQSEEGRGSVFLVLGDLAANAWLQGQYDLADELYDRAEERYQTALAAGVAPLSVFDLSVGAANRARLAVDQGDLGAAQTYLASAQMLFDQAGAAGDLKANEKRHEVGLLAIASLVDQMAGRMDVAIAKSIASADAARALYGPTHPDRAMAIANAADLLMVLGRRDLALGYLREAVSVAEASMPQDAPLVVEINVKIALGALTAGDRAEVIETLRKVVLARQSPQYRDALPEAADNFEMLAWALLDRPAPIAAADLDEAISALQWTQVSRSSDALAMMEARQAAANPGHAALLKMRQDLVLEVERNRSALFVAYSSGPEFDELRDDLNRRQAISGERLRRIDREIAETGLDQTGIASITPMKIVEIQSRLGPGEVLVTFLLPGLKPEAVPGLDATSNFAIAVSATDIRVARIAEASRGALNTRIAAFRCEMAISDADCARSGAAGLRGAMLADAPEAKGPRFDWQVAHALYRDLFGGLDGFLDRADHLIIAPPSDLLRLPFQALITKDQPGFSLKIADWMLRRHAISVIPSIPALRLLRGPAATKGRAGMRRLLGIGDPAIGSAPDADCGGLALASLRSSAGAAGNIYGGSFSQGVRLADPKRLAALDRLPDSSCELRSIAASFGVGDATILTQGQATEKAVKALDNSGVLAAYDVLVFATHGLVAGETSAVAPGLVLTPPASATLQDDGLLTAAEIATLTLNADLVVLSACNTAAGETAGQEGLSGLASGFFHAGARSLLVTHWAVYSEAAVRVTTGVFAALKDRKGITNAAALRQSVLAILDDENASVFTRHPAYWAPFSIIGD